MAVGSNGFAASSCSHVVSGELPQGEDRRRSAVEAQVRIDAWIGWSDDDAREIARERTTGDRAEQVVAAGGERARAVGIRSTDGLVAREDAVRQARRAASVTAMPPPSEARFRVIVELKTETLPGRPPKSGRASARPH